MTDLEVMLKILSEIPFGNMIVYIVLTCLGGSAIVRIATGNKKNIFTLVLGFIGDSLLVSLNEKLDRGHKDLVDKVTKVQESADKNNFDIAELKRTVNEREAKRLRSDIICFADACRAGSKHTKKHYENILQEYSDYEDMCEKAGIENHQIETEITFIKKNYTHLMEENKFL